FSLFLATRLAITTPLHSFPTRRSSDLADKMYDIVMSWDWGNSGSPDIYHDTETRRNGITYRSNLARLAEALINNDENGKAEKVLDRKSTRLNSSHVKISYAVFCLKKKN